MPITRSAQKALRQSIRRRKRNVAKKEQMKKALKEAAKTRSPELISEAYKAIDKAAKTGVIKKNTAARKKSRLMKRFNALGVTA